MKEKYIPKVGEDFILHEADKFENSRPESAECIRERNRALLSVSIILLSVSAVVISFAYSHIVGNGTPVTITTLTAAPLVGVVVSSYFRG